jgi:hypothetical protein
LSIFKGTYGDYLTIFEQYGYVALFSAVSIPKKKPISAAA